MDTTTDAEKSVTPDRTDQYDFADKPGELWLEFPVQGGVLGTRSIDEAFNEIQHLAEERGIGEYSGRSSGSGAADISFCVNGHQF